MPCYYTGSAEGDRALAAQENADKLAEKLTEMTELACEAMEIIDKAGIAYTSSYKLRDWWKKHKKLDAARKHKEADAREIALAKLTKEDRHALGLDWA